MTQMHVGTASVNWGFDPLYDWTVTPAFDRLLDEMAACGYEGTEISYHFMPLGEGMVDMERIFGALRSSNYNGWVIVEQDAPADPLAAAMKSRTYLRERCGL